MIYLTLIRPDISYAVGVIESIHAKSEEVSFGRSSMNFEICEE